MSAKSTAPDLAGYRAWLQARECSAGTVEKYLRDVARFFAEVEAQSPAPKEAVAGWRDALAARGYAPSSVNAMLAAVNAYQTFSGNPQGRARPAQVPAARFLRGPARAVPPRILPPAGRRPPHRPQAHAAGAADAVRHRHPRLRAALHHGRGRAPGPRRDPLQGQVPRDPAAARAVQPPCALVPPPRRSGGPGVHGARRAAARAHHGLENAEGPVRAGRRGEGQGLPAQPAPPVRQDLLRRRKKISRSWRTCSATPASRRRASILWNRAPSTRSCSSACTCCCKATKVCFCCRTSAGYITEGSRSGRFAPPGA